MSEIRRGIPLTRARVEQIFPKLTPAQIDRSASRGRVRSIEHDEILYEPGHSAAPFFLVLSGELEVVRPLLSNETLITVLETGQFTGEVGILSGRRTFFRVRVSKPGKVVEVDRQQMQALLQEDDAWPGHYACLYSA